MPTSLPILPPAIVILGVALGGAIGAVARLGVYHAVHHHGRFHSHWTTLLVNMLGCLALGLILGWSATRPLSENTRAFLTVGILGAFTTFSTYAGDVLKLMQQHRTGEALLYLLASVLGGVLLCWVGYSMLAPARAAIVS